jgi:general secretion pathway protein K
MKRRERGFALLIVLWSLVLIGLMITQVLGSGRTAAKIAANMRDAAQARASADGAIEEAIYHVLTPGGAHWRADGRVHDLSGDGVKLTVQINSLAGKINPNQASTILLAGLMRVCGTPSGEAAALANAIISWRSGPSSPAAGADELAAYRRAGMAYAPPGHPFADLSELADVLGMNPSLLACALPQMSLYASGQPDPAQASALVRRALILSGQTQTGDTGYSGNAPSVEIIAQVAAPGRATASRRAIVSLAGADAPVPFQLLSLTSPPLS